jgi:hypothetical protein
MLNYLRDPIWQFVGAAVAILSLVVTIALAKPALIQRFWGFIRRGVHWVARRIKKVYLCMLWHLVVRPAKDHFNLVMSPRQATDVWRYDFYDNFPQGRQQRHPGSDIDLHPEAVCNGERKKAIFEHPPDDYKRSTIITYAVAPPSRASLLLLTGFVGIETFRPTPNGPQPSGRSSGNDVRFQIVIDDQVKFRRRKSASDWERFVVLFVTAGDDLRIGFATNNLGDSAYNWAVWGEPELIELFRLP